MLFNKRLILLASLIVASGCSTQPREFAARLATPPADNAAYVRDYATCRLLARDSYRNTTTEKTGAALASLFTSDGVSVAKAIRSDREDYVKAQMAECLAKYGYSVVGWKRASKTPATPLAIAQTGKDAAPAPTTK